MGEGPRYEKIELLVKENDSIIKIQFNDCKLKITNEHIIILTSEEPIDKMEINIGNIFNLNAIQAYKTYKKIIPLSISPLL